jgi:hypothetical protein
VNSGSTLTTHHTNYEKEVEVRDAYRGPAPLLQGRDHLDPVDRPGMDTGILLVLGQEDTLSGLLRGFECSSPE